MTSKQTAFCQRAWSSSTALLSCLLLCVCAAEPAAKEFKIGDEFKIECQDSLTKKWGPGPRCDETSKEITFRYGQV